MEMKDKIIELQQKVKDLEQMVHELRSRIPAHYEEMA